jgi:pullulanase
VAQAVPLGAERFRNDPRVNPKDWPAKAKHKGVFDYYKGRIPLRRAHTAFRMTDRTAVDAALEFAKGARRDLVEYALKNLCRTYMQWISPPNLT